MTLRLCLTGPDVFRPESIAHGEALKALYAESGFIGLYPLGNAIAPRAGGPTTAEEIYRQNIVLIDLTDAVLADVADFRGHGPDSDTCFKIGYAIARGKDVWCYHVFATPLLTQMPNTNGNDVDGWAMEDFGLPRNLMIACSYHPVVGDARACPEHVHAHHVQLRAGYAYADCFPQDDQGHPYSACTGWRLRHEASARSSTICISSPTLRIYWLN